MKENVLFYQLNRCTGCQLCVMACSLNRKGVCGENESLIQILTHPLLGTSQPMIEQNCMWEDCDQRCIEVCAPGVLAMVEQKDWGKLLKTNKWNPVPIFSKETQQ